jgi:hypothetical protein
MQGTQGSIWDWDTHGSGRGGSRQKEGLVAQAESIGDRRPWDSLDFRLLQFAYRKAHSIALLE